MLTQRRGKRMLLFAAVAATALILHPASASAQCAFNTPAKAKGYRLAMTRAYVVCPPPTPIGVPPNAVTKHGVQSCVPPTPLSPFEFDGHGKCSLKASHLVKTPCNLPGGSSACADLRLKARCGGIHQPGLGGPPINGIGWMLGLRFRLTIDEPVGGPMTVVDLPLEIPFPAANAGKLSLSTSVNEVCVALGTCLPELPPCTTMELQSAAILDPNGDAFVRPGSATR